MSADQGFCAASVLIPPITSQQVQEFTPGTFQTEAGGSTASTAALQDGNRHVSALVSSAFRGTLPKFVLSDMTSYYGDVHPTTLLPEGLGVMIFKQDASGIGSAFDGTFVPPRQRRSADSGEQAGPVPADTSALPTLQTKQQFDEAVKRRNTLLLALSTPFASGDRYGGYWRSGLCEGEGALITSSFTFQGQFSEGKPHGRGNMKYNKTFVDHMPPREGDGGNASGGSSGGGGVVSGIGAFLLKGLTTALLAPIPDALLPSTGSSSARPKEYIGDFHKTFLRHGKGLMKYANGDSYEGEWQFNRRDGYGKFVSAETGEQFEGHWAMDVRHGYGKVAYPDGSFFKGLFDQGLRNGEGIWLFPNGDEYYGHFENNRIQGEGTMKFKNGDLYSGSWKDGLRHGKGMYVLRKRNITVKGNFVKGLIEGEGLVEYPDTGVFVGDFERGERTFGSMFWYTAEERTAQRKRTGHQPHTMITPPPPPQQQQQQRPSSSPASCGAIDTLEAVPAGFVEDPRRCYQGQWVGENMHGRGLLWFKNGDFFSGHFVKNVRQGAGNMRYASPPSPVTEEAATPPSSLAGGGASVQPAREYSGQFLNDMRHGFGLEQSADGSIKAGRWECDVFVEGYEGEWDHQTFNGVGRLKLSLASFFQSLESNNKPLAAGLTASLSPPPISLPSLLSFLRASPGGEPMLSVFHHPAQHEHYTSAQHAWLTAVSAAQEVNDLFMVEFFGIFRNGRRDGSGVLKLPYVCEKLPLSPASRGSKETEGEGKHGKGTRQASSSGGGFMRRGASRLFRRGSGKKNDNKSTTNAGPDSGYTEEVAAAVHQSAMHSLMLPPTLLLRRHVIKGKWESNVLDCPRAVWSFPSGETYVGTMTRNARHQTQSSTPSAPAVATAASEALTSMTASRNTSTTSPARTRNSDGNDVVDTTAASALQAGRRGILYFPDGSVFVGSWKGNAPSGKGVLICKDTRSPIYERQVEKMGAGSTSTHHGGGRGGDGGGPLTPVALRESASRRRRDLRRSLTRRAADDDGDEELPLPLDLDAEAPASATAATATSASEATDKPSMVISTETTSVSSLQTTAPTKRKKTHQAHLKQESGVGSFLGIDFIINLFTGSAGTSSDEDDGEGSDGDCDPDAANGRHAAAKEKETIRKVFQGYEDHYYLFGHWIQEDTIDAASGGNRPDNNFSALVMPFTEYARKVAPKISVLPCDQRALGFEGTTMADSAMGLRPPPGPVAGYLASPYAQTSRDGNAGSTGQGNANVRGTSGGDRASGEGSNPNATAGGNVPTGSYDAFASASTTAPTQFNDFYMSLLPAAAVPGGNTVWPASASTGTSSPSHAHAAAGAPGSGSLDNMHATARTAIPRPAFPESLNVARVSGEGVYMFPSTGVCIQSFFLDNMPRLAVPYRPGSDLDRYLANLKQQYKMLPSPFTLPSECSDVGYLLNRLTCLRTRETFRPPSALVDVHGALAATSPHAGGQQGSMREKPCAGVPDGASSRFTQPLGVSTAYVPGVPFDAARSEKAATAAVTNATLDALRTLAKPEPLSTCTICGKAYSFFREASCCTLCFRSCCSSCLNDYEILNRTAAASTPANARAAGDNSDPAGGGGGGGPTATAVASARTGYTEVSALLATSYYLLQKLKKGAEGFLEEEARAIAERTRHEGHLAGSNTSGTDSSDGSAFSEITSKQLLTLLSGNAALPVCADCVRCILMRIEKQVQWIPLKLFSSVVKFENEDKLESAQGRAAASALSRKSKRGTRPRKQGTEEETATPPPPAEPMLRSESARLADAAPASEACEAGQPSAAKEADGNTNLLPETETPSKTPMATEAATLSEVPSPAPLPPPPALLEDQLTPGPASTPSSSHRRQGLITPSSTLAAPDPDDEGYAVYSGYTSHGIPHLFGEMWWWPGAGTRGRSPPADLLTELDRATDGFVKSKPYDMLDAMHDDEHSDSTDEEDVDALLDDGGKEDAAVPLSSHTTTARRRRARYLNTRVLDLMRGVAPQSAPRGKTKKQKGKPNISNPTVRLTIVDRGSPAVSAAAAHAAATTPLKQRGAPRRGPPLSFQSQRYYYSGSFSAGKRCGHGSLTFENGEKYVGFFFDNCLHGEGFYFSDDGAVVHGEWHRNRLAKVYYLGEVDAVSLHRTGVGMCFYNAVRHGNSLFFRDSASTEGTDKAARDKPSEGNAASGGASGAVSAAAADAAAGGYLHVLPSLYVMYNGQWRKGKKQGTGTLHLKGGAVYTGSFQHDHIHGWGVLRTPFSLFAGSFSRSMRSGHGVEFFFDVHTHHDANASKNSKGHSRAPSQPVISSAVEGFWEKDVSDGFVRIYQKKRTPTQPAAAPPQQQQQQQPQQGEETAGHATASAFEVTETTYLNGNERDDCFAAPLMKGDDESDQCLLCERKFHMFLRRHHCRLCGHLVCDSCSQKRARLPDHFYASEEEKNAYQKNTREAAFQAVAGRQRRRHMPGTVTASAEDLGAAANNADSNDLTDEEAGKAAQGEAATTTTLSNPAAAAAAATAVAAPQRVCEVCFFRLEQRRTLVVKKYADNSVYCGGLSKGRWVSRGLYWRADGLFFVFDDKGELVERAKRPGEPSNADPSTQTGERTGTRERKGFVLSSSVLQDASPTKEFLDSNPVLFSESSPTTALDAFLLWWVTMNTRCQLSTGVLDFPQLRAYKLLLSLSRRQTAAATAAGGAREAGGPGNAMGSGATVTSALATKTLPSQPSPSTAGKLTVVLAGSSEAHVLSVANLFPSSSHAHITATPSPPHPQPALAIDAASLRIAHDFCHWLHFPEPPTPPHTAMFVSYSDAIRETAKRRSSGDLTAAAAEGGASSTEAQTRATPASGDPNVEAALVRAARYHPHVLPHPPAYPFHRLHQANGTTKAGTESAHQLLPPWQRPPPLSSVDITDEELLTSVTNERVENFLPFAPPSQLQDTDSSASPGQRDGDAEHDMKVLACYAYQPLFPATPQPPAFLHNDAVKWEHWHTRSVPVYNPTRLPLTRSPNKDATPAVLEENALYYGCAFPPLSIDPCNEIIENGKIRKVAEIMLSRERNTIRRSQQWQRMLQRQSQRLQQRRAAKNAPGPQRQHRQEEERASAVSSSSSTSTESDTDSDIGIADEAFLQLPELVDGLTVEARAGHASDSRGGAVQPSANNATEAASSRRKSSGDAEALLRLSREQQDARRQQLHALLTLNRNDKAWLPEQFDGPFKFSLHVEGL